MSQAAPHSLQIPADWTEALPYLADLSKRMPLRAEEWLELGHWLVFTKFDGQSCLAGEVAATLIRDFAPPKIRDLIKLDMMLMAPNDRLLKALGIVPGENKSIDEAVITLRANSAIQSAAQTLQSPM